jgi:uncharacterized protein (DUF58 family)
VSSIAHLPLPAAGFRASGPQSRADGITRVDLAELIAMRARAGRTIPRSVRIRAPLASGHRSKLRGRGMDYAESRIYQAGDDVRHIDWRRTARSGKWHTKLFQEEREQGVLSLVDTHAAMRFGTRTRYKSVAAARAAAWLAWTSVRAGDRVGALAFGVVRAAVDPRAGTRGALTVLGALARWDDEAAAAPANGAVGEPLSHALHRADRLLAPGSRAMLLSDGQCVDDGAATAMARLTRHADLRAGILADALELQCVPPGVYVFETPEGRTRVDLSDIAARVRFRNHLATGRRRLVQACDAAGIPWTLIATDAEPDVVVAELWRRRRGRR